MKFFSVCGVRHHHTIGVELPKIHEFAQYVRSIYSRVFHDGLEFIFRGSITGSRNGEQVGKDLRKDLDRPWLQQDDLTILVIVADDPGDNHQSGAKAKK